jgi:hypothetical protein
MGPKEWAKANGFPDIKLGKGRMPADARAAVEAFVAGGGHIDGYQAVTPKDDSTETPKVGRTTNSTGIADIGEERRPEQYNRAYVGDREIGMRTVCNNCHSSLTYCGCASPTVYGYGVDTNTPSVVSFKPRPNPEDYRARWW